MSSNSSNNKKRKREKEEEDIPATTASTGQQQKKKRTDANENDTKKRCEWSGEAPNMIHYHDHGTRCAAHPTHTRAVRMGRASARRPPPL